MAFTLPGLGGGQRGRLGELAELSHAERTGAGAGAAGHGGQHREVQLGWGMVSICIERT